MRRCTSLERYKVESVATMASTIPVMARTNFVFSRNAGMSDYRKFIAFPGLMTAQSLKCLAGCFRCRVGGAAVFLELIVKGLQANAKDFRGAGLIVIGGRKCLEDQHFLGFAHSCPDFQPYSVGIAGGDAEACAAEIRRQMAGLNQRSLTHNDGT